MIIPSGCQNFKNPDLSEGDLYCGSCHVYTNTCRGDWETPKGCKGERRWQHAGRQAVVQSPTLMKVTL